ncbi:MAG: branched-chain amino acid ABC transporter permease [Desulfobacterota bacterium]|nr:branched-chain amino acid ABC transporter permease [Thermodesulfobacteriota bacterium]
MTTFLEILIRGVMLGSLYGLVGMGLTLVWGVVGIVNIAHGEFVMLGAYLAFWSFTLLRLNPLLSVVLAIVIFFFAGTVIHRRVTERLTRAPELSALILTFGMSIFLWNLAQFFWTNTYRSVPYLTGNFTLFGLVLAKSKAVSFLLSVALTAALFAFLKYSKTGKGIRATAQNPEVALVCGIDTVKMRAFTFGMGIALAGAAGSIVSLQWVIFPQMGTSYVSKAFAIVVLGGLGHIQGALAGGLILGILESLVTQYWSAKMAQIIPSVTILLILLFRPTGLFRR